jgi:hypothetical protein
VLAAGEITGGLAAVWKWKDMDIQEPGERRPIMATYNDWKVHAWVVDWVDTSIKDLSVSETLDFRGTGAKDGNLNRSKALGTPDWASACDYVSPDRVIVSKGTGLYTITRDVAHRTLTCWPPGAKLPFPENGSKVDPSVSGASWTAHDENGGFSCGSHHSQGMKHGG